MAEGESGGGSLILAELIDEHGAAIYSDFQAEYGLNLTDVLFCRSPRELLALVEDLQYRDGAFAASLLGGAEFRGWGVDRHMLANLWDLTAVANGVERGGGSKKPPTHPRPGEKKKSQGTPLTALFPSKTTGRRGL